MPLSHSKQDIFNKVWAYFSHNLIRLMSFCRVFVVYLWLGMTQLSNKRLNINKMTTILATRYPLRVKMKPQQTLEIKVTTN